MRGYKMKWREFRAALHLEHSSKCLDSRDTATLGKWCAKRVSRPCVSNGRNLFFWMRKKLSRDISIFYGSYMISSPRRETLQGGSGGKAPRVEYGVRKRGVRGAKSSTLILQLSMSKWIVTLFAISVAFGRFLENFVSHVELWKKC